jgi:Penicillinase repressor
MHHTTRERVERALLELYARFARDLRPGEPINVSAGGGRLLLELIVETVERLSPCEEDIVFVIRKAGGRKLTKKEVVVALDAVDLIWGESTVWQALAALVAKGVLVNKKDKRGYALGPAAANVETRPCQCEPKMQEPKALEVQS